MDKMLDLEQADIKMKVLVVFSSAQVGATGFVRVGYHMVDSTILCKP